MSEGSGHQGLWTEPAYPGDTVRVLDLIRGRELGSVRIQHYGTRVRVGSFLPGETECSPGDTPKTWPEKHEYCSNSFGADVVFDRYVQEAYGDGWQNYDRNKSYV